MSGGWCLPMISLLHNLCLYLKGKGVFPAYSGCLMMLPHAFLSHTFFPSFLLDPVVLAAADSLILLVIFTYGLVLP